MKFKKFLCILLLSYFFIKQASAAIIINITVNSLETHGVSSMCELPDALELIQNLRTSNNWYTCNTYIDYNPGMPGKNLIFNIVFDPGLFANLAPGQIKNIVFDKADIGFLPFGLHLIGPGSEKLQLRVEHDSIDPFMLYKNTSGLSASQNEGINLSGISIKNIVKNKTCFALDDPENIALEDMVFEDCTDSAIKISNHTDFLHDLGPGKAGKLTINNSIFARNTSNRGGAIQSIGLRGSRTDYDLHYLVSVKNSLFEDNQALVGGAFAGLGLAGLTVEFSSINNSFIGNKALWGGALHAGEAVNLYTENTTLAQNQAYSQGGAIYIDKDAYNFTAVYLTIAENLAVEGGGIYADLNGFSNTNSIAASIIADNTSITVRDNATEGHDIWVVAGNGAPNTFNVYDSLIKSPLIANQQNFFRLINTIFGQDPKLAPLNYYPLFGSWHRKIGTSEYGMLIKPPEKRYPPVGQIPVTNYFIKTDQFGRARFSFTALGAIEIQ